MAYLDKITYKKLAYICFYIMVASIGVEYVSKSMYLLEAATGIGLICIFRTRNFHLKKRDVKNILIMSFIMLGVMISRLFFTPDISMVRNVLFNVKMFMFFSFIYFFITRYGFPFWCISIMALFSLPHFLGHVLGINLFLGAQFAGFHGDPNYLAPDLLTAFGASMVLAQNKNLKLKWRMIFGSTLLITFYLLLITVSRTATLASLLIILFFITKSFFTHKRSFLVKTIFIALFGLIIGASFFEVLTENVYVDRLYARFFDSPKGGDLVENERYFVWGISFHLIQETGLFQGYGLDAFLEKQYHFLSHNSWLDIGVKNGSYTFWSHSVLYVLGFIVWGVRFFRNIRKIPTWGVDSYLLIFSVSISFMMFSISVSFMYYYWFILFLIYVKGIMPPSKNRYNFKKKKLQFAKTI